MGGVWDGADGCFVGAGLGVEAGRELAAAAVYVL